MWTGLALERPPRQRARSVRRVVRRHIRLRAQLEPYALRGATWADSPTRFHPRHESHGIQSRQQYGITLPVSRPGQARRLKRACSTARVRARKHYDNDQLRPSSAPLELLLEAVPLARVGAGCGRASRAGPAHQGVRCRTGGSAVERSSSPAPGEAHQPKQTMNDTPQETTTATPGVGVK